MKMFNCKLISFLFKDSFLYLVLEYLTSYLIKLGRH